MEEVLNILEKNGIRDKGEIKKDECGEDRQEIKILQKAVRIEKEGIFV